jgi:enoyl-CoA hydratase
LGLDVKSFDFLDIDVRDGVAVVTMNKPDHDNRFDPTEREEFVRLTADAATDDSVRALVLTGAGDVFSLGADHSDDSFDPFVYYDRSQRFLRCFLDLDKPVVMALNGDARGLGWTIALTGDVTIAERQVVFADTHVKGGVSSATGPFLWPLSSGLLRAKRYLLTGDSFDADTALDMGIVTEVVDTGQSLVRATEYATHFASLRPETLGATKRVLNQWLRLGLTPVYDHGLALEFMTFPKSYADRTRGNGNGS